jgi:hypothetical protein
MSFVSLTLQDQSALTIYVLQISMLVRSVMVLWTLPGRTSHSFDLFVSSHRFAFVDSVLLSDRFPEDKGQSLSKSLMKHRRSVLDDINRHVEAAQLTSGWCS